jgi:hypothetical protein
MLPSSGCSYAVKLCGASTKLTTRKTILFETDIGFLEKIAADLLTQADFAIAMIVAGPYRRASYSSLNPLL